MQPLWWQQVTRSSCLPCAISSGASFKRRPDRPSVCLGREELAPSYTAWNKGVETTPFVAQFLSFFFLWKEGPDAAWRIHAHQRGFVLMIENDWDSVVPATAVPLPNLKGKCHTLSRCRADSWRFPQQGHSHSGFIPRRSPFYAAMVSRMLKWPLHSSLPYGIYTPVIRSNTVLGVQEFSRCH